jgi:Protein of unknown function (DUF5661)
MKITNRVAMKLAKCFQINLKIVPFDEWVYGLNVELEHGDMLGRLTNISHNDLEVTAKIAIAHLIEDPRYYYHLSLMEAKREKYWSNKMKPSPFLQ